MVTLALTWDNRQPSPKGGLPLNVEVPPMGAVHRLDVGGSAPAGLRYSRTPPQGGWLEEGRSRPESQSGGQGRRTLLPRSPRRQVSFTLLLIRSGHSKEFKYERNQFFP